MRMVCPACSAAYEVPDSLLAPGRAVRCARCANEWVPSAPLTAEPPPDQTAGPPVPPPHEEPAPSVHWPDAEVIEQLVGAPAEVPAPETPRFTAMDRLALHRASIDENPLALRLAWAASITFLLLVLAFAYLFRTEVVHVWPASQRLYSALGVMASSSGRP